MKNVNIGIVNYIISNKLKESYFNKNLIEESKKLTYDVFDVIKKSPILQLEFKVFDNIENKHIENELIASRYIDNNIKLFEVYTNEEITSERKKLNEFIIGERVSLDNPKVILYNAIDTLIKESLNDYDKINVDKIHELFTIVLNHIKEPKNRLDENVTWNDLDNNQINQLNITQCESINSEVIEIAIDKFNEKYSNLNEDDNKLFKKLIKSTDKEKEVILEEYKAESLLILENINKDSVKENIARAIQKIKEMKYNKNNADDDIISLHELKKELL